MLWPASRTLGVVSAAGIDAAVAWVAEELRRGGDDADERIRTLTAQLVDIWPAGRDDSDERGAPGRARMLRLLLETRDEEGAARFLRDVIVARYDGSENEALSAVLDMLGPPGAAYFLLDMIGAHLRRRPAAMLGLLWRLDEAHREAADADWDVVLREAVRAVLEALSAALPPEREKDVPWTASRRPTRFSETAVHHLFALAWRLGLADDGAAAAGAVAADPRIVSPYRALPAVLAKLHAEEGAAGNAAFARLWRHAADALLARSAEPPTTPGDWTIAANAGCRCEHCDKLRDFCNDLVARTARFPLRKDLRAHLHQIIDRQQLDIEHVTERRGRPFTLVCTKTRASHKRRLAEYAKDVSCMQGLIEAAPGGEQAADRAPDLAALRAAVTASETA